METKTDHNKLITKAAREILKPAGLFQKGTSRTWIDDNGWFLTVVEFQPSGWETGSYLNVAVNFLWDIKDHLSFDFAFKNSRQDKFKAFSGDEDKFYREMLSMSELALKQVNEYRKFSDIEYARKAVLQKGTADPYWDMYHKLMMCGFAKDPLAVKYFEKLTESLKNAQYPWQINILTELNENIKPVAADTERLYAYIAGKINVQREFWRGKASMKKLKEIVF